VTGKDINVSVRLMVLL